MGSAFQHHEIEVALPGICRIDEYIILLLQFPDLGSHPAISQIGCTGRREDPYVILSVTRSSGYFRQVLRHDLVVGPGEVISFLPYRSDILPAPQADWDIILEIIDGVDVVVPRAGRTHGESADSPVIPRRDQVFLAGGFGVYVELSLDRRYDILHQFVMEVFDAEHPVFRLPLRRIRLRVVPCGRDDYHRLDFAVCDQVVDHPHKLGVLVHVAKCRMLALGHAMDQVEHVIFRVLVIGIVTVREIHEHVFFQFFCRSVVSIRPVADLYDTPSDIFGV